MPHLVYLEAQERLDVFLKGKKIHVNIDVDLHFPKFIAENINRYFDKYLNKKEFYVSVKLGNISLNIIIQVYVLLDFFLEHLLCVSLRGEYLM